MGCGKSKVKKLTDDHEKIAESGHFNNAVISTSINGGETAPVTAAADVSLNSPTGSDASTAEAAQNDPGKMGAHYIPMI